MHDKDSSIALTLQKPTLVLPICLYLDTQTKKKLIKNVDE